MTQDWGPDQKSDIEKPGAWQETLIIFFGNHYFWIGVSLGVFFGIFIGYYVAGRIFY